MFRTTRTRASALLAAACGALLSLGPAAPAAAHAALVGTEPGDGGTAPDAPAAVSATFSEILDGPSTLIAVTDPAGETLALDEADFDGDTFTQPMRYTTPGEYTVAFRVISEDGHRVDDAFGFTVEDIPRELRTEGGTAASDPSAADADQAAEGEDTDTGMALAMILLSALVVVVGGVLLVKLLGRKSKDD